MYTEELLSANVCGPSILRVTINDVQVFNKMIIDQQMIDFVFKLLFRKRPTL
jgi:hypothetical protein